MSIQQIIQGQNGQETVINENFVTLSQPASGGYKQTTTSGLVLGYYGGQILVNGAPTTFADATVTLTASATNYVSISAEGVVSTSITRNTANAPLCKVVTGTSTIASVLDERDPKAFSRLSYGKATIAMADANQTLTQTQSLCDSLTCTGANTALRNLVVPAIRRQYTVFANTTTNGVQVISTSGTGITIAVANRAIVEFDGTNVVRITADV